MKIALIQSNPVTGALTANMDALIAQTVRAAELGADLCVAPEMALCGHTMGDMLLRSGFAERCREALGKAAAFLGANPSFPPLLLGAPVANPVPQGKSLQSCAVLLSGGKVTVAGRKVLLPSSGVHDDARYFEPGVACGVIQLKGWRLGIAIGEDAWNDRTFWPGRHTFTQDPVADFIAAGGADGLINLTALPYEQGLPALHQRMLGHLAARYRAPVASVNLVGGNDSLVYFGQSAGFDRTGTLIARAPCFGEALLMVDMAGCAPGEIAPELSPDEEIWQAVVLGARDYVGKCGFTSVALGLSGGVDSALTAAIAVEAFGPENVTGLLMPSPYSSRGSLDDATALAENLGIATRLLPIDSLLSAYAEVFNTAFGRDMTDLAEENIQPRIRAGLLMACANSFGALLLSTGNKSEAAVGYATLYGDMAGALAPIGDLYKGQVYSLCRHYNATHPRGIPEAILNKPPSAELRPGQRDDDTLPPYPLLDPLLKDLIDGRNDVAQLLQKGYDAKMVYDVMRMVHKAEFKRRQAPPALHLSSGGFAGRTPVAAIFEDA
ncbi:MAG: NAD+ synthase [Desulfovibrio sp.]|jgi:NAD+ synthase (glutamine-hydrolysing)|nr:NAD+ synthase [Desulfovibrio sp.]